MKEEIYNLHSKFDYKKHNDTYICYCEVIILPNGTVHYAVPSHSKFLENYIATKQNIFENEVHKYLKNKYQQSEFILYGLDTLIKETKAVAVYYHTYYGTPNKKQLKVLQKLQTTGCCEFDRKDWM